MTNKLNSPFAPKDDGHIGMPAIQAGMNKRGPKAAGPPDGAKDEWSMLGRTKKEDSDAKILERARSRMQRCIDVETENRKKALNALKFKAGDQWPADIAAQRNTERRPCITVNKIPTFIHQVTNDQRQNRPSINISPVGDRGDVEAAQILRGMIRHIERTSRADIAYDTAFESAVSGGWGYWRILLEWESPDSFNQVIVIKRVRNPFTVYLDPDAQEPDGADCSYGFVTEFVPLSEYKDLYKGLSPSAYDLGGIGDRYKDWSSKDGIRVAEYYEITYDMRTYVQLSNGFEGWADELHDDVKAALKSGSLETIRERESQFPKVMRYKLTAIDILEREEWIGKWIPIIKVIGNEIDVEGKVQLTGLVHDAIGPQLMYNYWRTMETELVALAPKAPYIIEEGQIEGYERQWKNANTKSYPVLIYKGSNLNGKPAPPPQRQPPVQIPAGVVGAAQSAAMDMQATTGVRFDASMQERMTDESGKAIRELRRSGDIGSFHYVDNLSRALKHSGDQLIDLICSGKIYDEKRVITILREDDKEEQVTLDPNARHAYSEVKQKNEVLKVFNPREGKYGVTVTVGPSFATKRIEAAESMMAFAKSMPQTASLIADLIAKSQDWPGAEEMATRLAKAVPPPLMTPDSKDMSPQVQAIIQNLEQQVKQLHDQLQQAMAAVKDKEADRDVAREKIQADFEAKVLGVIQKAESDANRTMAENIRSLSEGVNSLIDRLRIG